MSHRRKTTIGKISDTTEPFDCKVPLCLQKEWRQPLDFHPLERREGLPNVGEANDLFKMELRRG
jgi:hypothetical protein